MTLVTTGSEAVIQQIVNQLNKLIDVVSVEDMTRGEHLERELVLLKLRVRPEQTDAVRGYVVRTGGRVLDPAVDGFIVELTASEAEINAFIASLRRQAELLGSGAQRCAGHRAQQPRTESGALGPQCNRGERELGDRSPANEMLLDDALQIGGCAFAIPDAVRINHRDRPSGADAQALRLGAQHAALPIGEVQFLQAALQIFP